MCAYELCERSAATKGLCHAHYAQQWRGETLRPVKARSPKGTRRLDRGYVLLTRDGRQDYEHRFVMEQMIGRRLLPGESVHHKNGVRNDNRPENLELWAVTQPSGQRVSELVDWAKEILARYETVAL